MEVHHHPRVENKRLKEYFLEFLMIFLAVTAGFFAESYREYSSDRKKEKEYMESMVKDLQRDTAFLNTGFPRKLDRIKAIDSVFLFFESHKDPQEVPGYIVAQIRRTSWDRIYDRSSGTINQLKNAGGLRLIKNRQVADSIAAYDLLWERSDFWKQGYISLQNTNNAFQEKILNAYDVLPFYRNSPIGSGTPGLGPSLRQLTSIKINTTNLNEYLNFLWVQKSWINQDYEFYQNMMGSAARLVVLIKKEYHLE